jgi:hypothetical protein
MTTNIAALKRWQDERNARKQALIAQFVPFRDSLFERLEEWTKEADAQGLEGVTIAVCHPITSQVTELTCTINGFQLVLIASERVLTLELPSTETVLEQELLAARVLVYVRDSDEEREADLDIPLYEDKAKVCHYRVRHFGRDEVTVLRHQLLSDSEGRDAADVLIDFICGCDNLWNERPTLKAMRQTSGGSHQRPDVKWKVPDIS